MHRRMGAIAALFVPLLTGLTVLTVADGRAAPVCNLVEPTADAINLFDSSTSKNWVRQIYKAELPSKSCSLQERNGRYLIQLSSGEVWVSAAQFRKNPPIGNPVGNPVAGKAEEKKSTEAAPAPPTMRGSPRPAPESPDDGVSIARSGDSDQRPRRQSAASADARQYVKVLYATNRVIAYHGAPPIPLASITFGRDQKLNFGAALVRVPDAHKVGEVERPADLSIFGVTLGAKEDEKKHFILKEIRALDRDRFVQALQEDNSAKSAMVFIHGYNTSFDDAIFKTAQIAFDSHFHGAPIAMAWPSKHTVAAYDYDRESAAFSWDALLQLLHMIREDAGISKVYIIAHSMGNQILLEALAHAQEPGKELALSEIIMASPDVDRDVFVKRIDQLKLLAGGLTLYASAADRALLASHLKSGGVRAGDISVNGPVTVAGLDTIDITALGHDPLALNHGTSISSRSVIDDIGKLLLTGMRPPGVRSPQLIPEPTKSSPKYWKYPN